MKIIYYKAIIVLMILLSVSCVPKKQLSYFNDINELEEPGINPRTAKTYNAI